ncbi:UNVERIFIED_CONTAM: hypothetical protein HDU68_009520 [Siphonaria sp. JEL0065]|nr:hypothetical protein HDU68_009520 [Siphonaria sp. JEL0065]
MTIAIALLCAAIPAAIAQWNPNGPTQPGLPDGCVGSFPNLTQCHELNWYLGESNADKCKPAGPFPIPGEQVYIKDEQNFCINLPNPDSIVLQNNYYLKGVYPTIVQAEGYVQSYCIGDYLPAGSKRLPWGGIRAAHVIKNYTVPRQHYLQVGGYLDCDLLKINCIQSFPGAYDDGGQYDNEPYSGVDPLPAGNGHVDYVEMAGNGMFCMRTCEANSVGVCTVQLDTVGCGVLMNFWGKDGFTYTDVVAGIVTTATVSLPPLRTMTGSTVKTVDTTATKSGASSVHVSLFVGLSFLMYL